MNDIHTTNCDNVHERHLIVAKLALYCMAATDTPDNASMDIQRIVVFRNARRGPLVSNCRPYVNNSAMETGLTKVIANG